MKKQSVIGWIRSRLLPATKYDLEETEKRIMAKVSEIAGILAGIKTQLEKAKTEIITRITDLEIALQNVDLPADAETALEELKTSAQALDDINPDVPPPVEPPPTP